MKFGRFPRQQRGNKWKRIYKNCCLSFRKRRIIRKNLFLREDKGNGKTGKWLGPTYSLLRDQKTSPNRSLFGFSYDVGWMRRCKIEEAWMKAKAYRRSWLIMHRWHFFERSSPEKIEARNVSREKSEARWNRENERAHLFDGGLDVAGLVVGLSEDVFVEVLGDVRGDLPASVAVINCKIKNAKNWWGFSTLGELSDRESGQDQLFVRARH